MWADNYPILLLARNAHQRVNAHQKRSIAMAINTYDDLRTKWGIPHSKSQIARQAREKKFPAPDGYAGKFPFWTDETLERYIGQLIAQYAAKRQEADNHATAA
jgi:hypothetical protein